MNVMNFAAKKQHRNGIKRPKSQRYPSLKGVSTVRMLGAYWITGFV